MRYAIGVFNTQNVDPMIVLMAAECETIEDECEVTQLIDREEQLATAAFNISQFQSKE